MLSLVKRWIVPAGYAVLPVDMHSEPATRLLLAIGLQESGFRARRQYRGGPARGFWQFEEIAVREVLTHPATKRHASVAWSLLGYPDPPEAGAVHRAIEHNDILAFVWARLLLWRLPDALPAGPQEAATGWRQYTAAWRPGKPHPQTWEGHFLEAWDVTGDTRRA